MGEEYESYEQAVNDTPVRAFRVNTDKISLEEFEKINPFSTEKITYVENGFYFTDEKIGKYKKYVFEKHMISRKKVKKIRLLRLTVDKLR